MSELVCSPVISIELSFEEKVEHYVCCETPDNFFGVTKTFCGLSVMEDSAASKRGLTVCKQCVEVATRPGCPLGHDCEPE